MRMAWNSGTPYVQLKRYTFWSYVFLAALPVILLATMLDQVEQPELPWFIAYGLVIAALGVVATRVGWNLTISTLEGDPVRWRELGLMGPLAVVAVVLAVPATPPNQEPGLYGAGLFALFATALVVLALSPGLRWYWSGLLILVGVAAVVAAWHVSATLLPDPPAFMDAAWQQAAIAAAIFMVGTAAAMRMSVWMVDRVHEQEQTSAIRADLAVAEERLRFSRDLHDIFGRTLTAVALKSDLAAELAAAGQTDTAAAEMREVHRLSEEALREVRAVVAGYREINLTTEIAGARAVLEAAGVRVRVLGEPASIPEAHSSALAWAVREGVTNVVRHASATTCTLDLRGGEGSPSVLTISNDGVRSPSAPGPTPMSGDDVRSPLVSPLTVAPGSGLAGLADRLRPLGGTVSTEAVGDTFELRIEIPGEVR
ncbi:MAG: histidine kinase [bacterium]|nr:histidine kinase [bacterium]